jgi:hypothetical protein
MKSSIGIISSLVLTALFVPASRAIVIDGTNYVSSGPTENLTAVFTTPTGGVTTNLYSGYVLVEVSGSGHSAGTQSNDAFYVYTPGPTPYHTRAYYLLTFGTSPLVPFNFLQGAGFSLVYDVAAGLETGVDYVPPYNSAHTYSIVLDSRLLAPGSLYFGVSDGNFSDNGGAFNISVAQLAASQNVPDEGATALLWSASLLGLILCRRYRSAANGLEAVALRTRK